MYAYEASCEKDVKCAEKVETQVGIISWRSEEVKVVHSYPRLVYSAVQDTLCIDEV